MNNWNKKNLISVIIYTVLYVVGSVIVSVTGAIHPIFFVCYQITAGLLLSGVIIKAFSTVKATGVAACLSAGMILTFFIINDASVWHIMPLVVIAVLAEMIRKVRNYDWIGDVISTVIMTFSTFGFYGQIWLNRDFTYEAAIEEMPAGYGDTLMSLSPGWVLPVVVIIGVAVSVCISNVTAKLFKIEKN